MLVKKTAALSKTGGGKPLAAVFSASGGNVSVKVNAEGVFALMSPGKISLCPVENGECTLEGNISGGFSACLFIGERAAYFGDFGFGSLSALKEAFYQREKSEKAEAESDVNEEYDDFAIAPYNYYPDSIAKKAAFPQTEGANGQNEQQRFIDLNQNSTFYPHNVNEQGGIGNVNVQENTVEGENDKKAQGGKPQEKGSDDGAGENDIRDGAGEDHYIKIKESLNALLSSYPRVRGLESLASGSVFVSVPYDGERYYVAGLMRRGGKAEYIVYGVPAKDEGAPPKELAGAYFVPESPFSREKGYFLIYQSAESGAVVPCPQGV